MINESKTLCEYNTRVLDLDNKIQTQKEKVASEAQTLLELENDRAEAEAVRLALLKDTAIPPHQHALEMGDGGRIIYKCARCRSGLVLADGIKMNYCRHCGQKVDWAKATILKNEFAI